MKKQELIEMIREEILNVLKEQQEQGLEEKSVPQPYNRKSPPRRKMSKKQVKDRKKIGDAMMKNSSTVDRYKKKYGDDWKDYIWATASGVALKRGKE
jgi:hypothetical protein